MSIPLRNKLGDIIDYALVSPQDFDRVNQYKWNKCTMHGYVQCKIKGKSWRLHRYIKQELECINIDGVGLNKKAGTWRARVTIDGKEISLGTFKTELEAAHAREEKIKKLSPYSRLNLLNLL